MILAALPLLAAVSWAEPKDPLAGSVVRSKEYVVHRSPHKVEEFVGDVYYRNADRQIKSDWARFDHQTQVWRARGHVQAFLRMKDGSVLLLWGEEAEHGIKTGRGWMKEKDAEHPVRFEHGEDALKDQGVAHRLEWDQGRSLAWARGDVHVWGERGEAWAETAEYVHAERTLTLTGRRPVLVHHEPAWSGALQAERIRAIEGERKLQGDERVKGWILFENLRENGIKK